MCVGARVNCRHCSVTNDLFFYIHNTRVIILLNRFYTLLQKKLRRLKRKLFFIVVYDQ
jgi:hypothetical protein